MKVSSALSIVVIGGLLVAVLSKNRSSVSPATNRQGSASASVRAPSQAELQTRFVGRWYTEQLSIGAKNGDEALSAVLQQLTEPKATIDLVADGTYSITETRWVLGSEQRNTSYGQWTARVDAVVLDGKVTLLFRGGRLFAENPDSGSKLVLARAR